MTTPSTEATIDTIGLDIAKNSLSVHRLAIESHTILTKDLKREQMLLRSFPLAWLGITVTELRITVTGITVTELR